MGSYKKVFGEESAVMWLPYVNLQQVWTGMTHLQLLSVKYKYICQ